MKTDLSKELKTWLREQHITMDSKIRNDMSFERDTKYDEGYVAAISDMIFKLEDLASGGEKAVVWAENINKKIDRRLSSMTLPLVHEQEEEDWHKQYRLVLRGCKERIKESLKLNLPDDQMQDVMLYLDGRRYEAEHNPFFHEGIVDACNLCLEYITDETNKYYDEMRKEDADGE